MFMAQNLLHRLHIHAVLQHQRSRSMAQGLRISELIGLNMTDIQDDALRVLGKGNKVRIVYLNDACKTAISRYLAVRRPIIVALSP